MVLKRIGLTLVNIFCPPLAVYLLCGAGEDLLFNCLLFLLAVFPAHIHSFYISRTYFSRKGKVRKGRYPGNWRRGIYSERVQNGGASNDEVRRLRQEKEMKGSNRFSRRNSRKASQLIVGDEYSEKCRDYSTHYRQEPRWDPQMAVTERT